jgi:salicylate hydroxylase
MKVVVVGGGVAGTVSAIALARMGADVTVVEAYPDPAGVVGSFVSLATNGLRGLDALGVGDRVRARGFEVPRLRMWSGSGKLLGDVARGRVAADPMHSVTLMRASLVAELRAAAAEDGVRVVTGLRLEGLTEVPDGVRAEFDDGTALTADLLVGADGIWSTTRRLLDPEAPTPEYAGVHVVSGRASGVAADPEAFDLTFGRSGAFLHVPAPDGEIWWQAQVTGEQRPDLDGATDADLLARLTRLFATDAGPSAVLAATTRLHRPTLNWMLAPVRTWRGARTLIIGDAAHPVGAGQGASMAIEDGLALAAALAGAPSVPEGLAAFEADRRPRVTKMLKASDDNRKAKQAAPWKLRVQEVVMPIVVPRVYERATGWLYDYDPPALFAPPTVTHG